MRNLFAILLLGSSFSANASDSISCLPKDVTQDTLVSGGESPQKVATVRETLRRIGARCEAGKLVDKTGREIYFFHRIGCWGNPPQNYQDLLAAQAREIDGLKGRYTVLEISCAQTNPRSIQ